MGKFLKVMLVILSVLGVLNLWMFASSFSSRIDLDNTIPIESVEGGGICKSSLLVKNINTEDQVVLRNIIYDKSQYGGTVVSVDTVCGRIFYSDSNGEYLLPTVVPNSDG